MKRSWLTVLLVLTSLPTQAQLCGTERMQVQILGSGAGDLSEDRAAPSLLVWIDGKTRVLVDTGPGATMRFVRSNAAFADLDTILLTNLHANRTADLPALIQHTASLPRARPLPIYGPNG